MKLAIIAVAGVAMFFNGCAKKQEGQPVTPTPATGSGTQTDSVFLTSNGSMAMNAPDQFNWTLFSIICQKAPNQHKVGPSGSMSNDAVWETWADDPTTYPANPDPNNPPKWPTGGEQAKAKKIGPITQLSLRAHKLKGQKEAEMFAVPQGGGEEVRRNKYSFDYIIGNNLWYTQGLAANFKSRVNQGTGEISQISFPIPAIEVKAVWKPISKDSMKYYHWNYDETGKLYGLVALHIMSKAIPNWTWATWEWVGNPGRCDYIGCHDNFGVVPDTVNPNSTLGQQYPPGSLTPALLALFKQYNIDPEWQNYRLKGSQIDWINSMGVPTHDGNSVTEAGFVQTSSCITCHSVASFDSTGSAQPTVGFQPPALQQSQLGPVSPGNFYQNATAPYGNLKYLQGDFVWGLIKAQSAGGSSTKK